MSKLLMLKGLPASGKSTYAKKLMMDYQGWKRVNKDLLREMLDSGIWTRKNEDTVCHIRDVLVEKLLISGFNVIVDDTNFAPAHQKELENIASRMAGADFEILFFDESIETCIERDSKREKPVGEKVIRDMAAKYNVGKMAPKKKEGIPAILCDIDGTLALMHNRGPFEWQKVGQDLPNTPVLDLVKNQNLPLILFSGRDEICRRETEKWLKQQGLDWVLLAMRPMGDMRKDCIVKRELYDKYVDGKFNIQFVLDDRDQVVRMWREELHLPCFQVAPGNF